RKIATAVPDICALLKATSSATPVIIQGTKRGARNSCLRTSRPKNFLRAIAQAAGTPMIVERAVDPTAKTRLNKNGSYHSREASAPYQLRVNPVGGNSTSCVSPKDVAITMKIGKNMKT